MSIRDQRETRAWRRLVAQVVREEPVCWLQLPGCTKLSTTGDHVLTVSDRPDLTLDRANVRGACSSCNGKRHNLPIESLSRGNVKADALSIFE